MKPKYITKIDKIDWLAETEREKLKEVTEKYAFRVNDYYLSLINWDDPKDPIRRLVIPSYEELDAWGQLDASKEHAYTKAHGLEHKYPDTALFLVTDVCGAYCRFCFRKRLFMNDNDETMRQVEEGLAYIAEHPEINNVLLTGGDPLIMSTRKLEYIISKLREIPHVQIIRIGSKMVAFNPYRIIDDPELLKLISQYSTDKKKIYIMTHFNHPRELSDVAIKGVNLLMRAGAILANQTPLLRGINDSPAVLTELFNKLSYIGIPPYYVFQGRPVKGNKMFAVPVEEGLSIFEQARMNGSGLAKRARFAMSHATGKIEIMGMTEEHIFFKYARAAHEANNGRVLVFERNPEAYWLDDYTNLVAEYKFGAGVFVFEASEGHE
jgi:KamA family protein